jgi:DNA-binding MarR family transcriptional regulator
MLNRLKEELICYGKDYKSAANFYHVSERTIRRWMTSFGIYKPDHSYHPKKLNMEMANSIRQLYNTDKYTQIQLAKKFKVSQGTIGRIVNNFIYKNGLTIGGKAEVVYVKKF